jgi:hypothetical protein
MPDGTKFAITDWATRDSAMSIIFRAVVHCCLFLVFVELFVDHPFFQKSHFMSAVRFSHVCSLRQSRSAAQLNVGNRGVSKGAHGTIRRFMALVVKTDHFRNGSRLCKNAEIEVGK